MTYKHRDIVFAYMDGKQIQLFDKIDQKWIDLDVFNPTLGIQPRFGESLQYRIKPETKKYRVAQMKLNTMSVNDTGTALEIEQHLLFVRWLTDWVEYEV